MAANLEKIVEQLSDLTVIEAAELSKMLEEKWGVSAAAPVAVASDCYYNYSAAGRDRNKPFAPISLVAELIDRVELLVCLDPAIFHPV